MNFFRPCLIFERRQNGSCSNDVIMKLVQLNKDVFGTSKQKHPIEIFLNNLFSQADMALLHYTQIGNSALHVV